MHTFINGTLYCLLNRPQIREMARDKYGFVELLKEVELGV
jgi:hypothetical protein